MSYSKLTDKYIPAATGNYNKGRNGKKICKITPHHMAGNLTVETCGKIFQNPNRRASSNYGIGTDGRIACYVNEEDRSWCSSSRDNDYQAITIEVANDGLANTNWHIGPKAMDSLIELCVDICQRYDFKLTYDNTPNGSLTRHNMFSNTTCPGPYLQSKFPYIVDEVNKRLEHYKLVEVGTPVRIREGAALYYASTDTKVKSRAKSKTTKITKNHGVLHPYNTTGNLGWMDEDGFDILTNKEERYIVKKGDTLSKIGKKFGIPWLKLYMDNIKVIGLNPGLIKPGQELVVRK